MKILFGIVARVVGMDPTKPALAQWGQRGYLTGLSVALFLLGVLLTLAGGGAAIHDSG
ncbi:MAG: hypothetical protein KIS67_14200 [Verrucomicrobiae bacterium]|nr:hypothetical protein [Verrucomicrobiae bacterium]